MSEQPAPTSGTASDGDYADLPAGKDDPWGPVELDASDELGDAEGIPSSNDG